MILMKVNECPECGNEIVDRWQRGRKLQQACEICDWQGEIRIPEKIEIKTVKEVTVNQFYGFCYQVFDRYGHIMTYSKSYETEGQAEEDLLQEIEQGKRDEDGGPYVGILWPSIVNVKGKIYGESLEKK